VANVLKYIYSFFSEIYIEKTSSEINPGIEVTYVNGKKVLNTKKSNYSYGSLHRVFQKVFKKIKIQDHEIREALILGFGAGSVATILLNEYGINCEITGVEKDDVIIDIAKKHFNVSDLGDINIINEDAAEFIKTNDKRYDLVVVDVYIDNDVPEQCETDEFINNIGEALNSKGLIVFNKLVYNKEVEESAKKLHSRFENILGGTEVYTINDNWTNWMLICNKGIVH
jgi:spermidine synthase